MKYTIGQRLQGVQHEPGALSTIIAIEHITLYHIEDPTGEYVIQYSEDNVDDSFWEVKEELV
jgi:hypothetical protein